MKIKFLSCVTSHKTTINEKNEKRFLKIYLQKMNIAVSGDIKIIKLYD